MSSLWTFIFLLNVDDNNNLHTAIYRFLDILYSSGIQLVFSFLVSFLLIELKQSRSFFVMPFLVITLINFSQPFLAIVSVLRLLMQDVREFVPINGDLTKVLQSVTSLFTVSTTLLILVKYSLSLKSNA